MRQKRRHHTGKEHRHDRQEIERFKKFLGQVATRAQQQQAYALVFGETIYEAKPEKPEAP